MNSNLNYKQSVEIADKIFWIGFHDKESGLHCNPYLILDGDEAVIIDGGSRPDFPIVMMKILQTGVNPSSITALIYQHYDPDLCGSIANFEDIIGKDDLNIISDAENMMFIRHYYTASSSLLTLEQLNNQFEFSSGRRLKFIKTPYSHCEGSFITFDEKTKVLFTSDIFGSYSREWNLFLDLQKECHHCSSYHKCPSQKPYCPFPDMLNFHKKIMTSNKALRYAVQQIYRIPFKIIAPQHGSVISKKEDILTILKEISHLSDVGIDGYVEDDSRCFSDRL